MKLSILIPVHNEQATLRQVLDATLEANIGSWSKEIIAVNDGSSDGTEKILRDFASKYPAKFRFVSHGRNLGKGSAINTALALAGGDYVVIQDADLEYSPAEFIKLLSQIRPGGKLAAVFGNRGVKRHPQRGWHYVLGAKLLTWTFDLLFWQRLSDLYTCYKLFPKSAITQVESSGFEMEVELAAKLCQQGAAILEVPIDYHPRSKIQGKHIGFKDAVWGFWAIWKYRVKYLLDR